MVAVRMSLSEYEHNWDDLRLKPESKQKSDIGLKYVIVNE